ncbi:YfbU family protein [Paenibacillus daejeonensis]|uniref:YfbU family protein n=1 Tax=Paenibacillus daejeonensis TaxID=135193 RepID=UPI00036975FB|nr:YfbU family protein [Paenibacillus daejeonensis]
MLSKAERVILANQYEIMKALDSEASDYYESKIAILRGGYSRYYGEILDTVDDDFPEEISDEVVNILRMFRSLLFSYQDLSDEEKSDVLQRKISFKGFDGNEEGDHYNFCKYLLNDADSFHELQTSKGYNSHRNTLPGYRRMLRKWEELKKKDNLSFNDINHIVEN